MAIVLQKPPESPERRFIVQYTPPGARAACAGVNGISPWVQSDAVPWEEAVIRASSLLRGPVEWTDGNLTSPLAPEDVRIYERVECVRVLFEPADLFATPAPVAPVGPASVRDGEWAARAIFRNPPHPGPPITNE